MPENAIEEALEKDPVTLRQLAAFTADWLSVQVTLEGSQKGADAEVVRTCPESGRRGAT